MVKTPCVACGLRDGELSLCFPCIRLRDENFPVSLGLSIRRFARRAEVERLYDTVWLQCDAAEKHTAIGSMNANEVYAALDRLAAMAMEADHARDRP